MIKDSFIIIGIIVVYGLVWLFSPEKPHPVSHVKVISDKHNRKFVDGNDLSGDIDDQVSQWKGSKFHLLSSKWKRCILSGYEGFPPFSFYKERPVVIFLWHTLQNFLYIHEESVMNCSVPCYFASEILLEPECLEEVDGFVFHPPTASWRTYYPRTKYNYQYWVLFSSESEVNYPLLEDVDYRKKFDINMTYHLDSDVPFTYFISLDFYTTFWKIGKKTSHVPIMMMLSNCDPKSARNEYISHLMKYIDIDSYGVCFNNKEIPEEMKEWPWWQMKWNLTSRYKFAIGFENSIYPDYVTEKLYHPLIVGTVPIYLGAPNIDEFMPSERSIIKVSDFSSPKELALYLRWLDENDDEYQRYLSWKKTGPSEKFKRLEKTSPRTGPCRLCKEIAARQVRL